jgi:hypothetical protein
VKIVIPNGRDLLGALSFSAELPKTERVPNVEFSFESVDFTSPGWMLLVVRTLREFRAARPGTHCKVVDTTSNAMSYAGHAGFFDALGLTWGRAMGEASDTSTFVPIRQRSVRELFDGHPLFRPAGDIIQEDAERLSALLAQAHEGPLFETLSYAIREIVRNVVEHSGASDFHIAAQCWLPRGVAEIAIADAGIGITAGLIANGKHAPSDDAIALSLATQPGVSGVFISRHADDAWANSGYGLYMAKGLADGKRGFTLVSGEAALIAGPDGETTVSAALKGTCVVLRLRAESKSLEQRLAELVSKVGGTPSRASMSARVGQRKR